MSRFSLRRALEHDPWEDLNSFLLFVVAYTAFLSGLVLFVDRVMVRGQG